MVGDVVKLHGELRVVTEMTNGQITNTEMLISYLAKHYTVNFMGESVTIFEILQDLSEEYVKAKGGVKNENCET